MNPRRRRHQRNRRSVKRRTGYFQFEDGTRKYFTLGHDEIQHYRRQPLILWL